MARKKELRGTKSRLSPGDVAIRAKQREATTSEESPGYVDCACRDCFDVAIGTPSEFALCNECEEYGCDKLGKADCERCGDGSCSHSDHQTSL